MALHTNFSVTDPSAIHVGASAQKKSANEPVKINDIQWNDDKNVAQKEGDGFSFFDLLDVVNPLQHVPIISSIYRYFSGDNIKPAARMAGGALFGGPVGAALSGVDAIVAQETGQYTGDRVMASLFGDKTPTSSTPAADIMVAEAVVEPKVSAQSYAAYARADDISAEFDEIEEFLFEDFTTQAEEMERQRRINLARDTYLKSMTMTQSGYGGAGSVSQQY